MIFLMKISITGAHLIPFLPPMLKTDMIITVTTIIMLVFVMSKEGYGKNTGYTNESRKLKSIFWNG